MPPPSPIATGEPTALPTPEQRAANSLSSALLLAFVGGSLDSFLYLNHGHVFAGAMTGNAVLCGIALLSHHGLIAVHHALPLAAFFCGVWLAEVLQTRLTHHAVTIGLACEAAGLLIASFLPTGFPNLIFVPWIALLAAYQIASFRKVDQFSYNSTFITGDLRTAVVGLYEALDPQKRAQRGRQARDLGLIVGSFIGGAVAGALLAPRCGNHTLWLPAAALLIVLAMAIRQVLLNQHAAKKEARAAGSGGQAAP